ncbi:hypothetical protein KBA73_00580 [Patescibacteria group bacterium]|nr:hypothetical protein [Patescibacteria group bacterium]
MSSPELQLFIKEALSQGISRQDIQHALKKARWNEEEIQAGLDRYVESDFPIAIPAPKSSVSAREAFIYLILFVTFYLTAFSIGSLWFDFINTWIPDSLLLSGSYLDTNSIRQACATLLITAPLFFFLSWQLRVRLAKNPEERNSPVRRWLTYLTLFIAASVIIGTLIGLVHDVLSGELTWRFTLKSLTVLLITGSSFGYYLWDLRRGEEKIATSQQLRLRLFSGIVMALTALTLIGGLYLSGSPAHERVRRLDEQHLQTLRTVTYYIDTYYTTARKIPNTLEELLQSSSVNDSMIRRQTQEVPNLSYRPLEATTYELCADFGLASEDTTNPWERATPEKSYAPPSWNHPAGHHCFLLNVTPPPTTLPTPTAL